MTYHAVTYGAVMVTEKVEVVNEGDGRESRLVQIFATPRDRSGHFAHTAQHTFMNMNIRMQ